ASVRSVNIAHGQDKSMSENRSGKVSPGAGEIFSFRKKLWDRRKGPQRRFSVNENSRLTFAPLGVIIKAG
ncbi:MAG: hypothetical protein J6331_10435, partial [Lentisphaeria bacterium]|nr:hypothetical protein [Lentisphaeria bacterium]